MPRGERIGDGGNIMYKKDMSPILKWSGGKTQLLWRIASYMPSDYCRYVEPFLGGGAVLLGFSPVQAFINDVNESLVNLYRQIKDAAETVIHNVNELDASPCNEELYYAIRDQYNQKITSGNYDAECAALMIWLNKHCFNGLYRVNSKGLFNVPFNGKIHGRSIDEENVRRISRYLRHSDIQITCMDFERACDVVRQGDFVYFDSPYVPESITASFTYYNAGGFSLDDHKRLAALFRRLDKVGAKCMLSNNDVPLVRELYDGFLFQSFDAKRMINCKGDKQIGREVLITNYGF